MPTITFSLKDLQKLVNKKLTIKELEKYLEYGKGEIENYSKDGITVNFGDTNLPYLWSVEGIARLIKGILGKQKGIPKIKINKSNYKLIVDNSVKEIRPYISAFVAKNKKIDDYLIKQIIQLQEKLCENYGVRRKKLAIGVYNLKKINFPVNYKAVSPEAVKFIPLDFKKQMNLKEILEEHPKGKDYSFILKDCKKYPILIDSKNNVLSFPPIINSASTGKIDIGDEELFFECTGTDLNSVLLATNIFAQALYERGFQIFSVDILGNKKITTPYLFNESISLDKSKISSLLGINLKESEIKNLLEKMQYEYNKKVKIPHYRKDILSEVDIIEDIAIAYGYDKLKELPLKTYTIGSTSKLINFIDNLRELLIGMDYQEVFSPILTNKELYKKINLKQDAIEIENYMSETYSSIRSTILPILIEFLSKNKHAEYPQKIFEQGLIVKKDLKDYEYLTILTAHEKANYTEIRQVLDALLSSLNLEYSIEDLEHNSFIPGRVGKIIVNKKEIGFLGEIHPIVMENFSLENPVAALEINLSELYKLIF